MKKSQLPFIPQFFGTYINKVEDIDVIDGLEQTLHLFENDLAQLKAIGDKTYQEGKWTVKEIIQHIIDNERIQAYRALRIARNDKTVLPGYDEGLLAQYTNIDSRTIESLIEEFSLVRKSNIILFKSFSNEMLLRTSVCYQVEVSALSLGFVLIGHQIHHLNVIKEKYLVLLK